MEQVTEVVHGVDHDPGDRLSLSPLSNLIQNVPIVDIVIPSDVPATVFYPPPLMLSTLLSAPTMPPVPASVPRPLNGQQVSVDVLVNASILSDAERQAYDVAGARPRTHPPWLQLANVGNPDEEDTLAWTKQMQVK